MTRLSRSEVVPALAALAFGVFEVFVTGPTNLVGPRWALGSSVVVACVLLLWRHRRPLLVQALVVAVGVGPWLVWGASESAAALVPLAVSTVAVGRSAPGWAALVAVPVTLAAILAQLALDPLQRSVADGAGWLLFAPLWAAGAWLRQHDQVERGRDAEERERTRAAVAEERVRIAREMHDVLAHTVSVMVVQAEAAEDALDRDPAAARVPLQRVHGTGREALREVRQVLAVLRSDERADALPTPRLADLGSLVERAREAGLPVELHVETDDEPPAEVSRAVHRLCQEALTNVVRHAGRVPVRIDVRASGEHVHVQVVDEGPPAHLGAGHGLLGMRERVEGVGGELVAAPRSEGGFAVAARLPLDRPSA
jgi:signal transduction histidine kinase